MALSVIASRIERRVLVNLRVDADVVARILPPPFRPQLVKGHAVAGICFIRLGQLRPAELPARIGLTTENAAHRIAVDWDADTGVRRGVYIPWRDTDSMITALVGGRLCPGRHDRARFAVSEADGRIQVSYASRTTRAAVTTQSTSRLTSTLFDDDLETASALLRQGPCRATAGGSLPFLLVRRPVGLPRWFCEP